MKHAFCLSLACLIVTLGLCGCFKVKQDFAVNPDGSGKVTLELQATLPAQMMDAKADPNDRARQGARDLVSRSQGVTAWKDVSFSGDKDGKMTIKGTACFKDINKFEVPDLKTAISCKPLANGVTQLEIVLQPTNNEAPAAPPKLTEEEIKQKIAEAKAQFNKQLPRLTEGAKDLRLEWSFTLPGAPDKVVNFEKVADRPNTVRLVIEGMKFVEAMKALSNDDAHLRVKILAGNQNGMPTSEDMELLNEKLFGTKAPITVTFKPGDKPLFDWAAESEAAKKAMPDLMKILEAPATPAAK